MNTELSQSSETNESTQHVKAITKDHVSIALGSLSENFNAHEIGIGFIISNGSNKNIKINESNFTFEIAGQTIPFWPFQYIEKWRKVGIFTAGLNAAKASLARSNAGISQTATTYELGKVAPGAAIYEHIAKMDATKHIKTVEFLSGNSLEVSANDFWSNSDQYRYNMLYNFNTASQHYLQEKILEPGNSMFAILWLNSGIKHEVLTALNKPYIKSIVTVILDRNTYQFPFDINKQ